MSRRTSVARRGAMGPHAGPGRHAGWAAALAMGFALVGVSALEAQQGDATTPPPPETDTVQLVFDREVFRYPSHARRNPFRPLSAGDVGPSFEELVLLGTIVTDAPSDGVALVGVRGGGDRANPGETHRLRVGQSIGNSWIRQIHQRHIVVDVVAFGLAERRVLEVQRTEPQADGEEEDVGAPPTQGDTTTPPPDTIPPPGGTGGGDAGAGGSGTGADQDVGSNGNGGT
jgi:hypothetical protein